MATIDTILNIKVQGTDTMTQLKTEIDKTSQQLKDLKKEAKQAGANQKEFNAKIVTAETKLKGLRGELTKSKTELIKNAKAAADTSKSYDSLTKQNAALSQKLRKLADPLGKNRAEFDKLSKQINNNTNQLKKMDSAMGRSQRNVGNYKQAITSVALAATAAIAAFRTFTRAIASFADFEFQMKQVGALSGATAAELDLLTESAKELGRTTTFTAGEVAGFQVELAKLGFDPTEIEGMTSSVLDLAFAFDNDLTETGNAVAITLNAFNLEAEDTARVTDVLAASFANSALDLSKFTTAFSKVAPIAAASGFEIDDVTTLLGALSDSGFEASSAGTALKNIFLNLADSNGALAQTLGRSISSVEELGPALAELEARGIDVAEALDLTDKRSAAAFLTLVKGGDDLVDLNKKINDSAGFTKELAEIMRDSLKGALAETSSAAQGFVLELIENLEPAIRLIVAGIGAFFSGLTTLIKPIKAVAVGLVTYKAVVIATAIAQKGLTAALFSGANMQKVFAVATGVGTRAVKAFNLALKSNPIGLVTGLLATGAAMLFSYGEETEEVTEKQEEFVRELTEQEKMMKKIEKIGKDATDRQNSEIAKLKTLRKTIENTNLSMKDREQALNEFNKLAGTNIKNLTDEKNLVKELQDGYDNAVAAIKRKIIIQSAEDKVAVLIKKQLELENDRKNILESEAILLNQNKTIKENIAKADQERAALNLRTSEEVIEGGENLIENTRKVETQFESQLNTMELLTAVAQDNLGPSQDLINIQNQMAGQADETERSLSNLEDAQLSNNATTEAVVENARLLNSNIETTNHLNEKKKDINEEIEVLEQAINREMTNANALLDKIVIKTTSSNKAKTKSVGVYAKLKSEISDYETKLKNQIATQQQEVNNFLNSDRAKELSADERAKEIEKIEEKHAKTINKTTQTIIAKKQNLNRVEEKLNQTYKDIDKTLGEVDEKEKSKIDNIKETITLEEKREKTLNDLVAKGAELANAEIRQALKVAKLKLQLALEEANASGTATDAQIENINRLQEKIDEFDQQLQSRKESGTGKTGFLQSALFGTDEATGGPLTGEQLIEGLNVTFDAISGTLGALNELQNERLNTQLATIEGEKKAEVDAFLESNEAQVMSEEEKADKIEEIEKGFDDEMLKLKLEQFKKDQNLAITQATMSGAQAIMNILASNATGNLIADGIIKGIMIAATIAMTGLQIATIKAQKPPTAELGGVMDNSFFAKGGMVHGRSHSEGGEKFAVGGRVVELEGGEAVINKKSTAMFKPQLSAMNVAGGGRKFADGGLVFETDNILDQSATIESIAAMINSQQVLLVEADVTASQKSVQSIESRISF